MNFFYQSLAAAAGLSHVSAGMKINLKADLLLAHDGTGGKLIQAWEKPRGSMRQGQQPFSIEPIGQLRQRRMGESILRAGHPASISTRIRRATHEVEPVSKDETEA